MVSFRSILSLALVGSAATVVALPPAPPAPGKPTPPLPGCGEVNIIFTGLPPYHPLVISQGFDPAQVDAGLRGDAAHIVEAGYNLRVVLMGPEQPMSKFADQVKGVRWDGTGVGYGVRGSRREDLTIRLEDIIQLYRDRTPRAPTMFDISPTTALWAIQRHFPLSSNCTDHPGTDLGFELFCDVCEQ